MNGSEMVSELFAMISGDAIIAKTSVDASLDRHTKLSNIIPQLYCNIILILYINCNCCLTHSLSA